MNSLEDLQSPEIVETKTYGQMYAYTPDVVDNIEKDLKALNVVKKILRFKNGKWDMNLYRASIEERDLLKEVLYEEK